LVAASAAHGDEHEAVVGEHDWRRKTVEKRLREMFSHLAKEVNLVDELVAERRAEARREDTK
jgi:hypothetical protein